MYNVKEHAKQYPFFVEYKEPFSDEISCDLWSEKTLNEELTKGEVKILYIALNAVLTEDIINFGHFTQTLL